MSFERTAVLGASTLAGRELVERLKGAHAPVGAVTLVDPGSEHATIALVGEELELATPRLADALEDADLVLSCVPLSPADLARVHRAAERAVVVDLSGTLGGAPFDAASGPVALGPGLHASPAGSSLLVAALVRSARAAGARRTTSVVIEPASEIGLAALDELHAQAVAVLSFQPLPTTVLGRQLVHDVASPGPSGRTREGQLRREIEGLAGAPAGPLLLATGGVFHGAVAATWADVPAAAWRTAMAAEPRLQLGEEADASPVQSVQREAAIVGRVDDDGSGGAWAWAAADTLVTGAVGNVVRWLSGPSPGGAAKEGRDAARRRPPARKERKA